MDARHLESFILGRCPGEVYLKDEFALAAVAPVSSDHFRQLLVRLVHGHQSVSPTGAPRRGFDTHGRGYQGWFDLRRIPEPRLFCGDQAAVGNLLAVVHSADDVYALLQALLSDLFGGPGIARDVFVQILPAAQQRPGNMLASVPLACAIMAGW